MTDSSNSRLLIVWALLSVVTLAAWWMGSHHPSGVIVPDPAVAVGAIAITVIKVRLIVGEFMDARHGPPILRHLTDAWLAIFAAAMLAAYFLVG